MKKIVNIFFAIIIIFSLTGCSCKKDKTKYYDNEKDSLVLSSDEVEGVFNPFYGTSGADNNVTGMTQISMLTADKDGTVAYGDNEPVITKDYTSITYDKNGNPSSSGDKDGTTKYQFVIKNGIKFSDGSNLTISDILFNMYVYLDPVYTGSSTMYSTDIVGLSAYRNQDLTATDNSNSSLEEAFEAEAQEKIGNILSYIAEECVPSAEEETDFKRIIDALGVYFIKELNNDWVSAQDSVEDYKKTYAITEPWQVFVLSEGLAEIHKTAAGKLDKDANGKYIVDYTGCSSIQNNPTKEACINLALLTYMNATIANGLNANKEQYLNITNYQYSNIARVLTGFNSGNNLHSDLVAEAKSDYFTSLKADGKLVVPNISGITVVKGSDYLGDNKYSDDYNVLQIVIKGVDPKAIWNFGFSVAPVSYYSDSTHANAAKQEEVATDGYFTQKEGKTVWNTAASNFGVEFGDVTWYNETLKAKSKVPMGAGTYKASTQAGETDNINNLTTGFSKDGMIYFSRNDFFYTSFSEASDSSKNAKIKYLCYKVVNTANIMNAIKSGQIAYATPSATQDNIKAVTSQEFLSSTMTKTTGYGYIGVNAKYIQDLEVRQAIMTALDTSLIKDYYPGDLCEIISRPMSKVSWVYNNADGSTWNPEDAYSYENDTTALAKIDTLLSSAGYKRDSSGQWYKQNGATKSYLKYTFTIAGSTNDHPAAQSFYAAQKLLNENGWNITVKTDSRALTKLSSGGLEVWAAAWGSTIDPDMYQVYHKDSKATSVNNWGYDYIKSNKTTMKREYNIILELSKLIDQGRQTLNQEERTQIYRDALDLVMDLAVEYPTYQRNDMYVYNTNIIDVNTLIPQAECTSYQGPMARIWEVSLKVKK